MAREPVPKTPEAGDAPEPEVLKPQSEYAGADANAPSTETNAGQPRVSSRLVRRGTYRLSHKATFIGAAVVIAILALNAGIITFLMQRQSKDTSGNRQYPITINQDALDKLGVNRSPVGSSGTELVINPNTRFNGTLQVGGDVSIAGQFKLNSKLSAPSAALAQLEAGNTSLSQVNVNGNGTFTTANIRNDLSVAGTTRLQGAVTMSQLVTINNNLNVTGSLAVGGLLSVNAFHASSLISDGSITIGGHLLTQGSAPSITAGGSLGSYGTVSISGNDAAGTIAVNIGAGGGGNGVLANVTFRNRYSYTPHIILTAVGRGAGDFYVNRTATGFTILTNSSLGPGGYAFDYMVIQ